MQATPKAAASRSPASPWLRSVCAWLTAEPVWLRSVTWPLLAFAAALSLLQNAPQVIRALFHHLPDDGKPWEEVGLDLVTQLMIGLAIVLVASALRNLSRPRIPLPVALTAAVLLGTFGTFNVVAYVCSGTEYLVWANMQARRIALPWGIAAAAWYFLQRANARAAALRSAELSQRRLEAAMVEARLNALQAQVEPHFLFNTLAHVRRLYSTDPLRARLMLDSFRAYLRSALPQMRSSGATVGSEVDIARAYLDVQQVRMGRRLEVVVDLPAPLRDRPFPSMMLLSLVENAVKHGLTPLPGGGTIAISARERDGALEVCVADTGCGIGEQIGSGVGLANIRGRLTACFGAAGELSLTPNAPRGLRAVIRVPAAAPRARQRDGPEVVAVSARPDIARVR